MWSESQESTCERAGWSKKTNKSRAQHCVKRARASVYQQLHGTTDRSNQEHSHKMKEQTEKTEGMRGGQQWQAKKKRRRGTAAAIRFPFLRLFPLTKYQKAMLHGSSDGRYNHAWKLSGQRKGCLLAHRRRRERSLHFLHWDFFLHSKFFFPHFRVAIRSARMCGHVAAMAGYAEMSTLCICAARLTWCSSSRSWFACGNLWARASDLSSGF
jgi:hypothetical protein